MSIFGAMFSGVSGLQAQSQALGMIADNISNVNTVGYKGSTASFSTLVTGAATATTFTPGGVQSNTKQLIDKQGLLQSSVSKSDIAIIGQGFFTVNTNAVAANGEILYTRAGSFLPDKDGLLRNTGGYFLQGWPTDAQGVVTVANPNQLSSLQTINTIGISGSAVSTTTMNLGANLPATDAVGATHTMTIDIFDSLGVAHTTSFTFTKSAIGSWNITPTPPPGSGVSTLTNSGGQVYQATGLIEFDTVPTDGDTIIIDGTTFEFDTNAAVGGGNTAVDISAVAGSTTAVATALKAAIDGVPLTAATRYVASTNSIAFTQTSGGAAVTINAAGTTAIAQSVLAAYIVPATASNTAAVTFDGNGLPLTFNAANFTSTWVNGATATAATFGLGTIGLPDGMTQYSDTFTTYFIKQNGIRFGVFNGVTIDEKGLVSALFDNGQTTPIFKIPVASFNNANGLQSISGNVFRATDTSGAALLNVAGNGAAGKIAPSALEASNIDIATEFTSMIVTQQAYSASAKIITVADEMLDEVIRIIR